MTLTLKATESVVLTATALLADKTTVDVDATGIYWQDDGPDGAVTLEEGPVVAGVATCTVTAGAVATDTPVNVQAYAVDPDTHATPLSEPWPLVIAAAAGAQFVVITGPADPASAPVAPDAAPATAAPAVADGSAPTTA